MNLILTAFVRGFCTAALLLGAGLFLCVGNYVPGLRISSSSFIAAARNSSVVFDVLIHYGIVGHNSNFLLVQFTSEFPQSI